MQGLLQSWRLRNSQIAKEKSTDKYGQSLHVNAASMSHGSIPSLGLLSLHDLLSLRNHVRV